MKKVVLLLLILSSFSLLAQKTTKKDDLLAGFKFGALGYISASNRYMKNGNFDDGKFSVNRAYFTIKKDVLPDLSFRMTVDTYDDDDGEEVRLKYLYAKYNYGSLFIFKKNFVEFGMVHTPWLDFEQSINRFRMQGKMVQENEKLMPSADFGVTFMGMFGGEMDKKYKKEVNKKYAGLYGSYSLGIYNGSGYKTPEENKHKDVQGRITIRPIPYIIPGLQFSYFGIMGQGNKLFTDKDVPADYVGKYIHWQHNAFMASYESKYVNITGQYFAGEGDYAGKSYDKKRHYQAKEYTGFSAYAEGKILSCLSLIGRYDKFDPNSNEDYDGHQRVILGVAYHLGKGNILLLDFDKKFYNDTKEGEENKDDVNLFKLTMQVKL